MSNHSSHNYSIQSPERNVVGNDSFENNGSSMEFQHPPSSFASPQSRLKLNASNSEHVATPGDSSTSNNPAMSPGAEAARTIIAFNTVDDIGSNPATEDRRYTNISPYGAVTAQVLLAQRSLEPSLPDFKEHGYDNLDELHEATPDSPGRDANTTDSEDYKPNRRAKAGRKPAANKKGTASRGKRKRRMDEGEGEDEDNMDPSYVSEAASVRVASRVGGNVRFSRARPVVSYAALNAGEDFDEDQYAEHEMAPKASRTASGRGRRTIKAAAISRTHSKLVDSMHPVADDAHLLHQYTDQTTHQQVWKQEPDAGYVITAFNQMPDLSAHMNKQPLHDPALYAHHPQERPIPTGIISTQFGDIDWDKRRVYEHGTANTTHALLGRLMSPFESSPDTRELLSTDHFCPVMDHCRAPLVAPIPNQKSWGGYCNYVDLYSKLEKFSKMDVETFLAEDYKIYARFPCALWIDPARMVGEFYIVSHLLPGFFHNCIAHGSEKKVVKWKKSGSPQMREMGGPGIEGFVQLMSQFAVARCSKTNIKLYSARVSCIVRDGFTEGAYIVQVRDASGDIQARDKGVLSRALNLTMNTLDPTALSMSMNLYDQSRNMLHGDLNNLAFGNLSSILEVNALRNNLMMDPNRPKVNGEEPNLTNLTQKDVTAHISNLLSQIQQPAGFNVSNHDTTTATAVTGQTNFPSNGDFRGLNMNLANNLHMGLGLGSVLSVDVGNLDSNPLFQFRPPVPDMRQMAEGTDMSQLVSQFSSTEQNMQDSDTVSPKRNQQDASGRRDCTHDNTSMDNLPQGSEFDPSSMGNSSSNV